MSKTKNWSTRALYLVIAVVMALGLLLTPATNPNNVVSADESEWMRLVTPSEKDWEIAPQSDIVDLGSGGGVLCLIGTGQDVDELYKTEYADYISPSPTSKSDIIPQLWKSTNFGVTWKGITKAVLKCVKDEDLGELTAFEKVALAPDDGDFIMVAVTTTGEGLRILISKDGGSRFYDSGDLTDAGTTFTTIIDKNVSKEVDDIRNIAIGGIGAAGEGLVYRIECISGLSRDWENATAYDGWDVAKTGAINSLFVSTVKFAPSWAVDKTVLVTSHTADATYLQSGTWGTRDENKVWNTEASFTEAVKIVDDPSTSGYGSTAAIIALPSDYAGRHAADRYLWVHVNQVLGGGGVIYRVVDDAVEPIERQIPNNPLLASVSYFGSIDEGQAIAGLFGDGTAHNTACCEGVQVYRNDSIEDMEICCRAWRAACKPPTGQLGAGVALASANFAIGIGAFGFGDYDEGAFQVSFDGGDNWQQVSMIDTSINYLSDVAQSPDCNVSYLASVNTEEGCGCDSVWMKDTELAAALYKDAWLRVFCKPLESDFGLLRLAPEETKSMTVYLVDRGTDTVYCDLSEGLACWDESGSEGGSATINNISDLAVKDASTIYALDAGGKIAMSDDYGATGSWEDPVDSEVDAGWTIAVLGDNVLIGGQDADVSYSSDGGVTFTALEDIDTSGYVTIAFDSYFDANDTIYAAVNEAGVSEGGDNGIYRWVINESDEWKDLGAEKYGYTGLVLDRADGNPMTSASTGSVLYASYIGLNEDEELVTGVARCLTPAKEVCCGQAAWDYLVAGLTPDEEAFYFMPKALKICGCLTPDSNSRLWVIDGIYDGDGPGYDIEEGEDGTVWTYEDCLAKAASTLKGIADGTMVAADPCECFNDNFSLTWERLCNACEYDIQIALDEDFTEIVKSTGDFAKGDRKGDGDFYEPPEPATPSLVVENGTLGCSTTFYWRVRVRYTETDEVIRSHWSDAWSFTVGAPIGQAPSATAPETGATDVPVENVGFTWEAVPNADSYTFVLSSNADLSSPLVTKTGLKDTAYSYAGPLDNAATYYWGVKAMTGDQVLSESSVSSFTTAAAAKYCAPDGLCFDTEAELKAHLAESAAPPPATPAWVWVVIGIGAVLVITVIVLIFRTRRV